MRLSSCLYYTTVLPVHLTCKATWQSFMDSVSIFRMRTSPAVQLIESKGYKYSKGDALMPMERDHCPRPFDKESLRQAEYH